MSSGVSSPFFEIGFHLFGPFTVDFTGRIDPFPNAQLTEVVSEANVLGSLDDGAYALLAVLLISSLLNALYFLPLIVRAYFPTGGQPLPVVGGIAEAPKLQLVAISITALGSVALFAYPQFLFNLLRPLVGM